jgi:DNA-binding MarR family transcriptional regulator
MRDYGGNEKNADSQGIVEALIDLVTVFERSENTAGEIMRRLISEEDTGLLKYDDLSLTEYHLLHHIGTNARANDEGDWSRKPSNGASLSKSMRMTRGGISKLAARLRKKGIIYEERLPDNKKEIYYRLTADGEKLFLLHEALHETAYKKFMAIAEEYSEDEISLLQGFLVKVIETAKMYSHIKG